MRWYIFYSIQNRKYSEWAPSLKADYKPTPKKYAEKIVKIDTHPEYEIDKFGSKFPKYEEQDEEEEKHEPPNRYVKDPCGRKAKIMPIFEKIKLW